MRSSARLLLLSAAAFLASASIASAATFQYGSYSVANEQNISISAPHAVSGGAGQIALHGSGANTGQTILAWCMDIYDFLQNSGTYTISPLTTAGTGSPNPILSTTQIGQIGALISNGNALINTAFNVSAAIQLAIWEIEYPTFASNGINANVSALAATYIGYVTGGTWAPNSNVSLLSQSGNQTLAFIGTGTGGQSVVPLPAALPLFATGLGALGLLGWRRKRKNPAVTAA